MKNTKFITISICFLLLHISFVVAQCNIEQIRSGKLLYNQKDTCGQKIGCWVEFDFDSLIFSTSNFLNQSKENITRYYFKNGNEIKPYSIWLNSSAANKISKEVSERFNRNIIESFHGHGSIFYSIVISPTGKIEELRILHGLHKDIHDEIYRVLKCIEQEMIFLSEEKNRTYFIAFFTLKI